MSSGPGALLAVEEVLDGQTVGVGVDRGVDAPTLKRRWHCVARFGVPTELA